MILGKKVALVMPAFRAEKTLEATWNDVPKEIVDFALLVDDASDDKTVQLAEKLGINVVVHDRNRGYGANQKTCYATALGYEPDIVVMLHPDYQYDPRLLGPMVSMIASGVYGVVIEHYKAGGHNAPPRRGDAYTERDICSVEKVAALGLPFWLAGGCASPKGLADAKAAGARGVQVGTAFACCEESGITEAIKSEIIQKHRAGKLEVITDFKASPTGYPFKRVEVEANAGRDACRACDLGYLRHVYAKDDGTLGYRCPAGPRKPFLSKGGTPEEAEGKHCLCNGLLATIGMGTTRRGTKVQPLVTWGEDMSFLDPILGETKSSFSASDVLDYLLT